MKGFARVAGAVPVVAVADIDSNRDRILTLWKEAQRNEYLATDLHN